MKPLIKFSKNKEKLQFVFKKRIIEYDLKETQKSNVNVIDFLIGIIEWDDIDEVINCMGIKKIWKYEPRPLQVNYGCGMPEYDLAFEKAYAKWYCLRVNFLKKYFRFN